MITEFVLKTYPDNTMWSQRQAEQFARQVIGKIWVEEQGIWNDATQPYCLVNYRILDTRIEVDPTDPDRSHIIALCEEIPTSGQTDIISENFFPNPLVLLADLKMVKEDLQAISKADNVGTAYQAAARANVLTDSLIRMLEREKQARRAELTEVR